MSATFEHVFAANYPGDHSDIAERHEIMGPNRMGEFFMAESAEYDPDVDKTRVEFALIQLGGAR